MYIFGRDLTKRDFFPKSQNFFLGILTFFSELKEKSTFVALVLFRVSDQKCIICFRQLTKKILCVSEKKVSIQRFLDIETFT